MRKTPAILTAAALVAALAACAPQSPLAGCDAPFGAGDASSTVTADGQVGSTPTVEFPTPLVTDGTQRSTVTAGEGDAVEPGDQVDFAYSVSYAKTGDTLGAFGFDDDGQAGRTAAGADTSAMSEALSCTQVGGRYALTTTAADGFGEGALAQLDIADDDTLVIVIDVLDAYPGKADGVNQLPLDGMPTVATAVDGTPGITVPATEPPSELRVSTIKAGGGRAVEEGDDLVVHYSGWVWPSDGGEVSQFQSTWTAGRAADLTADSDSLVPGFATALIGAKVGSQVLAVIPPDQGYGDTPPQGSGIPAGATLIFVIDVLGIRG